MVIFWFHSLPHSDGSQDAFELYYSETYSESSSLSLQDSHRSLASVSDGGDSNPALLLMQEYMITVSQCVCVFVCVWGARGSIPDQVIQKTKKFCT